jgi:hypothetical protein
MGILCVLLNAVGQSLSARAKQRELTQQTQQQAFETRQTQLFMQVYSWWKLAS